MSDFALFAFLFILISLFVFHISIVCRHHQFVCNLRVSSLVRLEKGEISLSQVAKSVPLSFLYSVSLFLSPTMYSSSETFRRDLLRFDEGVSEIRQVVFVQL